MTLTELLARQRIALSDDQVARLVWLAEELLRWNRRHNLTAITGRDAVYEKHLVDSLTLFDEARAATRLLDIGSGAGFPALPLKIACPRLQVVAVDAVAKKIAFQRHVARTLGLQEFTAVHGRAEQLAADPNLHAAFDLVTARALGELPLLVALATPFLARNGRLVAMKGPEADRELAACESSLRAAGWVCSVQTLQLPGGAARCLVKIKRMTP